MPEHGCGGLRLYQPTRVAGSVCLSVARGVAVRLVDSFLPLQDEI
ncbi:hypothetical protein [Pantoea agglomerans]|nr:hypothetical protein [Pantoea agglomerans]